MGKNQKGKKEEKWSDKAGSLSQERKIREKEIEERRYSSQKLGTDDFGRK